MAHRATNHRRNLAAPGSQPSSASQPISTKRVNPSHRPTSPPPPEVHLPTFSVTKPNRQPRTSSKSKEFPGTKLHQPRDLGKSKEKGSKAESILAGLDIRKLSVSLDGGRRRSLGSAQVDVADFLANNGARIVSVDMPPFMQIHAVDFARKTHDSLEKFTAGTLASTLKKEFDGVYGPAWHCIVGKSFGSFVTHSVGGFMYFSLDQKMYVLLFKTTVQRAD